MPVRAGSSNARSRIFSKSVRNATTDAALSSHSGKKGQDGELRVARLTWPKRGRDLAKCARSVTIATHRHRLCHLRLLPVPDRTGQPDLSRCSILACGVSPLVTCRSCTTWAFSAVSRSLHHDQSQTLGLSSTDQPPRCRLRPFTGLRLHIRGWPLLPHVGGKGCSIYDCPSDQVMHAHHDAGSNQFIRCRVEDVV